MPFKVGNGCLPGVISASHINQIARSDTNTSPDVSVWGKIKAFFCSTKKPEVLELIRDICHPQAGTTQEQVASKFEQLRTLAYTGFEDNVQSGRHGKNHFSILDENSQEMLSVTLDDAKMYTVRCHGFDETYDLTPQTAKDYEAVWSAWLRAEPTGEFDHCWDAECQMRACLHGDRSELDLKDFTLSTLPNFLPPNLTVLNASNVPLHYLPELPEWLEELYVTDSQLTSLPELPVGLQKLYVTDNDQLTSLPELPEGLQELYVMNNRLTSLPELPEGLQKLYIANNQLTSLPELPEGLQELDVANNQLTSLPESITGLSSNASIDISNNPLSERTRQAVQNMVSTSGYLGPSIHFSMADPSAPREARPLHQAVADWLTLAKEGEPAPADSWQSFGREDNAASFSAFLDRLSGTKNFTEDSGFKAQIASWLTQLAEDNELRAKTFAMSTEATSSCEDRVTLALNQMKNVQLVHNAEKGKYDNNLPELISAGREMFRLDKLEQIAQDKVSTLRFVDEIEVYLGYQNKLKEALELSSVTKEMRFFGVSGVTDSDLQAAELQVKTAENDQFGEWILQWAPLRSLLERLYPEDLEKLVEKKISDYDDAYRTLSDTELKPAGLTGNADAERAVGARALERAEQAFHAGLRPLADRMLGGPLKARWS